MKIFNLTQNIDGAGAPGREYSSAPWNNYSNTFFNTKVVPQDKDTQKGRSMIEMLGVLAIIGVLSVGGIVGYSKAMMKYRINKAVEQITLVAGNVRSFFAPQRNYEGLIRGNNNNVDAVIKKAKLVPDEMYGTYIDSYGNYSYSGEGIVNPFGGSFYLDAYGSAKDSFNIQLNSIPLEACIELASHNWQNANAYKVDVSSCGSYSSAIVSSNDPFTVAQMCSDALEICQIISLSIYFK